MEQTIDKLANEGIGFIEVNGSSKAEKRTLIVLGVARGGTSLIAGSLATLGVFMGNASEAPVFEDTDLADAFERKDYREARRIIERYNAEYTIWGFKRPASIRYAKRLIKYTRNPVLLIIFKDLFSIANRNKISMHIGLLPSLAQTLKGYAAILKIIEKRYCDTYLFSYEKVMQKPPKLIDTLCSLSGVPCDTALREKVGNFIEPEPAAYLQATCIGSKMAGHIDTVSANKITGWAAWMEKDKKGISPVLRLLVNGEPVLTTTANISRPDVQRQHRLPHDRYGFTFELASELKKGDHILVVSDEDEEIELEKLRYLESG